jgi:putative nucleotidyltransferase with HDIG domain
VRASSLSRYLVDSVTGHAKQELAEEAEVVAARVSSQISQEDLDSSLTGSRYDEFTAYLQSSALPAKTKRIKVWNPDGMVVYSNDQDDVGNVYPPKHELEGALAGETETELTGLQAIENAGDRHFGRLLEVYTPLRLPGSDEIVGAFEVYQDYSGVEALASKMSRAVDIGVGVMLAVVYLGTVGLVKKGSDALKRREDEREQTFRGTLHSLGSALDARDTETEGHSLRVAEMACAVGQKLGLTLRELDLVEKAGLLHDIGKIGVPDAILRKAGPLTDEEWEQMRRHPATGRAIVGAIPFLEDVAEVVYAHHERFDGDGYPRGLKGEEIPLAARIFTIVDAYDAMTSDRPYRRARSAEAAVEEIARCSGTQFDPRVVKAFFRVLAERQPQQAPAIQRALAPS